MAHTIRHPDEKINHMLILGSGEGTGKDFILTPLIIAMGDHSTTIGGEDLLNDFNDFLLSTKHLHINEAELGGRAEAKAISAKLKPLSAAPPTTLRVNSKGVKQVNVRNIVNCTMTTNSRVPFEINGPSRRIYALWTDVTVRDDNDEMTQGWRDYWKDRWTWMNAGGAENCIDYLRNVVDLSDFDPQAAPPVTDFLREIRESSKSPMEQTLDAFIAVARGCFCK